MATRAMKMDRRDWPLLGLLSILWGGTFFFVGVALKDLPPLLIVFARVSLAAMILTPAMLLYGGKFPPNLRGWIPFFFMALLNNVIPFSLLTLAQTKISSGLASILNATTPIFAAGCRRLWRRGRHDPPFGRRRAWLCWRPDFARKWCPVVKPDDRWNSPVPWRSSELRFCRVMGTPATRPCASSEFGCLTAHLRGHHYAVAGRWKRATPPFKHARRPNVGLADRPGGPVDGTCLRHFLSHFAPIGFY